MLSTSQFQPMSLGRSSRETQSCSIALAKSIFRQAANNVHNFKLRVLLLVRAPLLEQEMQSILSTSEVSLEREKAMNEELGLLEEAIVGERTDPQLAELSVIEQINRAFRFNYEELALRFAAQQDTENQAALPTKRLVQAVELQRSQIDTQRKEHEALLKNLEKLTESASQMEFKLKSSSKTHKAQLGNYLRELCILKEQLYRSYRDKSFVAKDVDLMSCIIDDDAGEDVSVDELLRARRLYRGAESKINALNSKVTALEEEIDSKTTFIGRMEEKARLNDIAVNTMRTDISSLNETIRSLETKAAEKESENVNLKKQLQEATIALMQAMSEQYVAARAASVDLESVASVTDAASSPIFAAKEELGPQNPEMQTALSPSAPVRGAHPTLQPQILGSPKAQKPGSLVLSAELQKTLSGSFGAAVPAATHSPQPQVQTDAAACQTTLTGSMLDEERESALAVQNSVGEFQLQLETAASDCAALRQRIDELQAVESRCEELEKQMQTMEEEDTKLKETVKQKEEEAREAQSRADSVAAAATEQSELFTAQLSQAAQKLQEVRRKNEVLARAYLSIAERLTALKSRAGLTNYKQRSNDYHFGRAESAICDAQRKLAEERQRCEIAVTRAGQQVQHIGNMLRVALEDLESQKVVHEFEIATLAERTRTVQAAFEALLQDFNRLRDEHLQFAGNSAETQVQEALQRLPLRPPTPLRSQEGRSGQPSPKFKGASEETSSLLGRAKLLLDVVSTARTSDDVAPTSSGSLPNERVTNVTQTIGRLFNTYFVSLLSSLSDVALKDAPLQSTLQKATSVLTPRQKLENIALPQQRIMAAWEKLRVFAGLEHETRVTLHNIRKAIVESDLVNVTSEPVPLSPTHEVPGIPTESFEDPPAESSPQKAGSSHVKPQQSVGTASSNVQRGTARPLAVKADLSSSTLARPAVTKVAAVDALMRPAGRPRRFSESDKWRVSQQRVGRWGKDMPINLPPLDNIRDRREGATTSLDCPVRGMREDYPPPALSHAGGTVFDECQLRHHLTEMEIRMAAPEDHPTQAPWRTHKEQRRKQGL